MSRWYDVIGSRLVESIATEVEAVTSGVVLGATFTMPPGQRLCSRLEVFLPRVLTERSPKWKWESLDGFFIARATRTGPAGVELVGTCILMSDQTVTPFLVQLDATRADGTLTLEVPRLVLGEPGGGQLGISGPPCNSPAANRLFTGLLDRLADVQWSSRLSEAPRTTRHHLYTTPADFRYFCWRCFPDDSRLRPR